MADGQDDLEVRDAEPGELAAITALRRRVWAALDPDREPARERGGYYAVPSGAIEIGAWAADGELLGGGRLSLHASWNELPHAEAWPDLQSALPLGAIALLSRLVVAPSARGLGVATALDDARIARARLLGARFVLGFSHALEGGHRRSALLRAQRQLHLPTGDN